MCLSLCLCGCVWSNRFQVATSTIFLWFLQNLAHVAIRKKYGKQIFEILILKFLANF